MKSIAPSMTPELEARQVSSSLRLLAQENHTHQNTHGEMDHNLEQRRSGTEEQAIVRLQASIGLIILSKCRSKKASSHHLIISAVKYDDAFLPWLGTAERGRLGR